MSATSEVTFIFGNNAKQFFYQCIYQIEFCKIDLV